MELKSLDSIAYLLKIYKGKGLNLRLFLYESCHSTLGEKPALGANLYADISEMHPYPGPQRLHSCSPQAIPEQQLLRGG